MADSSKNIKNKYRALLRSSDGKFTREDQQKMRKALDILTECCRGEVTITGENKAEHSLSVARIIVSELGLGVNSVVGALLAECTGKLPYSTAELQDLFGLNISGVLTGLRDIEEAKKNTGLSEQKTSCSLFCRLPKISGLYLSSLSTGLNTSGRWRVLLTEEQDKDCLRVVLSVCSYWLIRLGLYNIKSEMEDIAMKYLDPDTYNLISEKLQQTTASRNQLIREFSRTYKR